jgi:hypothetical protein
MSSAYGGGGGGVNIFIDASTGGSGGLSSSEVTAIAAAETAILSTRLVAGASAPFDTLEEVEQFLTNSLVLRSGMLGDLPAGGFKVTGLGAPIDNADAARLSDVNALATLVSGKAPIASPAFTGTATATDLSLSGQLTVNAGLTSVGDLVAITVDSQIAAESATKPLTVQTHAPGSTLTVQTTGSGSELQVRATGAGSALALSSAGHNVNVTAGASAYVGAVTGATIQTTGPAADLILETNGAGSEAIVRSDAGPLVFIAETTGFIIMRSGADLTRTLQSRVLLRGLHSIAPRG